jgi:hypothetical protein
LRLRKHSCPIRTGDILFDVAVNRGDGTLYAVGRDARFSGSRYDTIALTQSTDGGQSWRGGCGHSVYGRRPDRSGGGSIQGVGRC